VNPSGLTWLAADDAPLVDGRAQGVGEPLGGTENPKVRALAGHSLFGGSLALTCFRRRAGLSNGHWPAYDGPPTTIQPRIRVA